jgi:hypothetical protein
MEAAFSFLLLDVFCDPGNATHPDAQNRPNLLAANPSPCCFENKEILKPRQQGLKKGYNFGGFVRWLSQWFGSPVALAYVKAVWSLLPHYTTSPRRLPGCSELGTLATAKKSNISGR